MDELNHFKDDASFFARESSMELKKVKIFMSIAASAAKNIQFVTFVLQHGNNEHVDV